MAITPSDAFQNDKSIIVQGSGLLAAGALIGAGLHSISMTVVEPATGFANPATTPTQMMATPDVGQQLAAASVNNANFTNSISTPQMGMKIG
jgi:hypothetical protein